MLNWGTDGLGIDCAEAFCAIMMLDATRTSISIEVMDFFILTSHIEPWASFELKTFYPDSMTKRAREIPKITLQNSLNRGCLGRNASIHFRQQIRGYPSFNHS
jgi:hypothetical protein